MFGAGALPFNTMPIYTFIGPGRETIERLVERGTREVREDGKLFIRCVVPEQFAMNLGRKPSSLKERVRAGYHKLENERGAQFNSSYSKNQIKKAGGR